MIDIKRLESEKDFFIKNLELRGAEAHLVDEALEINQQRKDVIQEEESLKAYQNRTGEKIAELKKKKEDASAFLSEMKEISTKVSALVEKRHKIEQELRDKLLHMPNLTHPDVPEGKNEADNKVVLETGEKKSFSFKPLDHVTLGEKLGLLDFEKASQISGARFTFLRGDLARLERALAQFMLDVHTQEKGYEEICPPLMTHDIAMIGTGQLPKFKEDMFYIPSSKHYLLSTAEIPLVNLFRDEILLEKDLPFYVTAHTPCFRAEAGSYGKDTRGMIRQHQFYKVELVKITHPDKSYEEHEKLTSDAEDILQRLKLPYRKVILSTGDIGFAASKCYDLEVWFPSQNTYREISSCSNCEDFQARRANIRFRPSGTKPKLQFVHTLNGSGLAVGRTLIAVMENFQNEDGSITIPEVLQPYMSNKTSIGAS